VRDKCKSVAAGNLEAIKGGSETIEHGGAKPRKGKGIPGWLNGGKSPVAKAEKFDQKPGSS